MLKQAELEESDIAVPAAAYFGTGILRDLASQQLMQDAVSGTPYTPEQLKGLQRAMGGKHVPVVPIGKMREHNPMVAAAIERGAYKPGFKPAKGIRGDIQQFLHELFYGGPEPRRHQLRRGYIVGGPKMTPEVLAHEMGHATGRGKMLGLRQLGAIGQLAAPLTSYFVGRKYGDAPESSMGGAALRGGLAGLGTGTLMGGALIPEELRASLRGLKGLKQIGWGPAKVKAARRKLLKALGTYGLGITALPAAAGVAGALRARAQRIRKERESSD